MKKKISIVVGALLLTTNLYGAKDFNTLDKEIKTLKNILKKKEKENKLLNKKLDNLIKEFKNFKSDVNDYDLDDMSDRLDNTEMISLRNKISFSLGFKTRMDNYKTKYADGKTDTDLSKWSEKVYFTTKAKITDNMKFTGRLSMQKAWANSGQHKYSIFDPMQGRTNDEDSTLYVERAYIDWLLNPDSIIPVSLTIGRQPSSDGPSYNIKDNKTRKSTYSALEFDGASDGIMATFNTSKYISKSNFKLGYGKGFQYKKDNERDLADTKVYGLFFEKSLSQDLAASSLFQVNYIKINDMVADMSKSAGVNHTDPNTDNIGDMNLYAAMLEIHKIKNTNFDAFVHVAFNKEKPNGKVMMIDTNGDGVVDAPYGLLTNTVGDTKTKNGHAFWIGTKYSFNKKNQVGLEYNYGSRYWLSLTQGAYEPYNKLATRGKAIEGYYNYIVNRYAIVRFGVTDIHYKYTGSGWAIGKPMDINSLSENQKKNVIKQLTDYYLTLNILF
jgi:hypothetical protein